MGCELSFYADSDPPTHCFNPCGHMASEKTVRYLPRYWLKMCFIIHWKFGTYIVWADLLCKNKDPFTTVFISLKIFYLYRCDVKMVTRMSFCWIVNYLFYHGNDCRYWSELPVPHGCQGFQAVCPFCATPLSTETGFIKLIFQDNTDWYFFCDTYEQPEKIIIILKIGRYCLTFALLCAVWFFYYPYIRNLWVLPFQNNENVYKNNGMYSTVYVCNVANYVIGKADRMLEWHGTCFCEKKINTGSPGLAGGIFMGLFTATDLTYIFLFSDSLLTSSFFELKYAAFREQLQAFQLSLFARGNIWTGSFCFCFLTQKGGKKHLYSWGLYLGPTVLD